MTAESAVHLWDRLASHAVDPCIGGGWAVDALLGQQTREHSDLDIWVAVTDFARLLVALVECEVDRVRPWPDARPWNFVLHNGGRLRVDLHIYEPVTTEVCRYGSAIHGEDFPASALTGRGVIGDRPVRCESPEWAVRWHTGYRPRTVDRHDLRLLCARFGLELPDAYR